MLLTDALMSFVAQISESTFGRDERNCLPNPAWLSQMKTIYFSLQNLLFKFQVGTFVRLPIAKRLRFTSFVLANLPKTLTRTNSISTPSIFVKYAIVILYLTSGVYNGNFSTFN